MSDDGDLSKYRISPPPLKIPERVPFITGFGVVCARLQGHSVRECKCKLSNGSGWLECPPEARGVLVRAETTVKGVAMLQWNMSPPPFNGPVPTVAPPQIRRPDPEPIGELGKEPRTPEQVAAAIATEKEILKRTGLWLDPPPPAKPSETRSATAPVGGKTAGFTGNICANCQSTRMIRNGVCETCLDCYQSGECG
jgi:hypothetical protein